MNLSSSYSSLNILLEKSNVYANSQVIPNDYWNIVIFNYFDFTMRDCEIKRHEYHMLRLALKTLSTELPLLKIKIYTINLQNNKVYLADILKDFQIELLEFSTSKGNKLQVIYDLLLNDINLIILNSRIGCVEKSGIILTTELNKLQNSVAQLININDSLKIYQDLGKKFNFNTYITSDMIILKTNQNSQKFVNESYNLMQMLHSGNEKIMMDISLTITNIKMNNWISDIRSISGFDKIISYEYDILVKHQLNELLINDSKIINWKPATLKKSNIHLNNNINSITSTELVNTNIPYTHPEYLYYPYLDFNLPKIIKTDNTTIFNTNGFSADTTKINDNIYSFLFKRFTNKESGIFIRRRKSGQLIPKILNYIITDDNKKPNNFSHNAQFGSVCSYATTPTQSVNKTTDPWAYVVNSSWIYKKWTQLDIVNLLNDDNMKIWADLYTNPAHKKYKNLIIAMIIIGKTGGIIISDTYMPLKSIPDDFLDNDFIMTFENEYQNGIQLSYDIFASPQNSILSSHIQEILISTPDELDSSILKMNISTIYPSYYFNNNHVNIPYGINKLRIGHKLKSDPYSTITNKLIEYRKPY
jgi:hypothetical protein